MEENFNKLDNFLREHLNDASESRGWNVPDDAIFEKAMRSIADEKRKKRRGWILIPVLLVSALIVSEYLHTRQIQTLQGKITTLEDNLSRESTSADPKSSASSTSQEDHASLSATSTDGSHELNAPATQGINTPSTQRTTSPNSALSPTSRSSSTGSTSSKSSTSKEPANPNPVATQTSTTKKASQEKASASGYTKANSFPLSRGSEKSIGDPASGNIASNSFSPGVSPSEKVSDAGVPEMTFAAGWVTDPISSLVMTGVEYESAMPIPDAAGPVLVNTKNQLPVYVMSYGVMLGANQSWLTMKNIPPLPNANLYNYDNSQPGFSMYGFINKPFAPKFSLQAGLGYNVYNNKSILEDQFLFDAGNVTQMPNGESMYQTDYDVVNPLGEYDMLLEFRVSDQMQQNDVVVEYTTIEQTLQSIMLDLGVHYDLLTLGDFKVSLGTGFGLGYRSGLNNEFNVSTYYNGILQKNQMETPDNLDKVKRWYGQWLGNINLEYYPTDRLGIILGTQYNAGITSIRDGGTANGPLTFLHAFSLSAGVKHSF